MSGCEPIIDSKAPSAKRMPNRLLKSVQADMIANVLPQRNMAIEITFPVGALTSKNAARGWKTSWDKYKIELSHEYCWPTRWASSERPKIEVYESADLSSCWKKYAPRSSGKTRRSMRRSTRFSSSTVKARLSSPFSTLARKRATCSWARRFELRELSTCAMISGPSVSVAGMVC